MEKYKIKDVMENAIKTADAGTRDGKGKLKKRYYIIWLILCIAFIVLAFIYTINIEKELITFWLALLIFFTLVSIGYYPFKSAIKNNDELGYVLAMAALIFTFLIDAFLIYVLVAYG